GRGGNDTFIVDGGTDQIFDLGGSDVIVVSSGAWAFASAASDFTATAATVNNGNGYISTQGHAIDLSAATGANGFYVTSFGAATTIVGSAKDDQLESDYNADTLTGGLGNDTFLVYSPTAVIADLSNGDIVSVQSGGFAHATLSGAWSAVDTSGVFD